jgi:two-component system sensor histidine kinase ChiS
MRSNIMLTIRRTLYIAGLFVLILIGIRLIWVAVYTPPIHREAVQGHLDLRGWDIAAKRPLTLDGQWEFHPHHWIYGENSDPNGNLPDSIYMTVPGSWDTSSDSLNEKTYGYGSYRLRIQVDLNEDQIYSLRIQGVSSASELFVNGRLLANSGHPAESAVQYIPRNVPYTASFTTRSDEIDIVIQAANFHNSQFGGIEGSIKFGTQAALSKETSFSIGAQLAVCLILLMHAAYACILYFFGVRQKALFYFGMILVCAIMSVLIVDDKIILTWLSINYEWAIKLNNWSYLGVAVFLLQYAKQLMVWQTNIKLLRWYIWLCAGYSILILLAPADILKYLNLLNMVTVIIPFLVVPIIAWRAVKRGEPDSIYLFLGTIGFMNNMVWSFIKQVGWLEFGYYPVDIVVSFVVFATYWFRRYLRSSDQTAKLAAELQKADKLKDEFLVNTSHELRNPLHGILTIAQTIMDKEDKDPQSLKKDMKLLISVGKRMSHLLNDLLDLTRLRENRIGLRMTTTPIQGIAAGVMDMIRVMAEGKSLRLINQIPDSFPPVIADENRLIQILFNLLHNAVKFTDEGSITISAQEKDGIACIQISDTGIGIDHDTIFRIFQPYEQGPSEHSSASSGLGLGLSISKQLVELHGGVLEVASIPGEGSVFSFSLSISDQATPDLVESVMFTYAESAAAQSSSPEFIEGNTEIYYSGNRPSILAVDDDPTNLNILVGALSLDHYDIVTVTSGQEALSMLNSRDWDLVIADVMMPRMSGYELCQTIRERFTAPELPVLLLTARTRAEDIEQGFQAGANDYVLKPVDIMELRSRVKALTGLKKSVSDKMRMEAAWLQAQIQPHFLFNTLNSVMALSDIDTGRMRKLLDAFSHYLRTSFTYRNLDRVVPLEFELDLVRSYLYIEQERFEERLQVTWDMDENTKLMIPPLSIQPLVENAVQHGLMSRSKGGEVQIHIINRELFTEISIIDNGVGMDQETLNNILGQHPDQNRGIGLLNTHRRLKQLHGEGLSISSELGQGTTIVFRIPRSTSYS